MSDDESDMQWVGGEVTIIDRVGLHARPAVKLTKMAKSFKSAVEIRAFENRNWVDAKSPNAVMKLQADYKSPLYVRAAGIDAAQAVREIIDLVDRNFDA